MCIIEQRVISRGVYFIFEGQVNVFYDNQNQKIVTLNHGSYFGDISYIFKINNLYYFESSKVKPAKIFCLVDDTLDNIFDSFPEFQKIFELRALRR